MSRKDRQFWESARMNNATFRHYFNRLVELSISMFEWINLPDSIDPRYLELILFRNGQAVFFEDEVLGYLTLQNAGSGDMSVYNIPNRRRAIAVNGYQKPLTAEDSVLIYNNYLHTSSIADVELFAKRLYDLDNTIDINAKAQKTPVLIKCAENERMTMLNVYKQYEGNEPVIFGDKELNTNGVQVLNTNAPYVADKIYELKTQIWNEALTYLGISNVNYQKKERMVSDEVIRGQGGVIASRYSRLEARKEACDKINKMFGLNIDVKYRPDYREQDDEYMLGGSTENNTVTAMVTDIRTRSGGYE